MSRFIFSPEFRVSVPKRRDAYTLEPGTQHVYNKCLLSIMETDTLDGEITTRNSHIIFLCLIVSVVYDFFDHGVLLE